jgi:hypothetical protein
MTEKTEIQKIMTYARKPSTVALIKSENKRELLKEYIKRYDEEKMEAIQSAFLSLIKGFIRNLKDSPVQSVPRIDTLEGVEKLQKSMKGDLLMLTTAIQENYPLIAMMLNIPTNFNSRLKQLQTKHGLVGEENLAEALKHQKDEASKEAPTEATK